MPAHADRRSFLISGPLGALGALALTTRVDAAERTTEERLNVSVTTAFCKAWEKQDPNTLAGFLAPDCVLRLSERSPAIMGREAALARFSRAAGASADAPRWEINIIETFAKGPIVVNERHDRGITASKTTVYLVAGFFVVHDGKITEWTDFMLPGSAPF